MASRHGASVALFSDDVQPLQPEVSRGTGNKRPNCPETWKVAVALLLICALFLTGVVIGYLVSRRGRLIDTDASKCEQEVRGSPAASTLLINDGDISSDDPRLLEQRHWNLLDYLGSVDYQLTPELR
jgi:hypothetical protein